MRLHIDIPAKKIYVWEDNKSIVEFPFALIEHMNAGHILELKEAAKYEKKMYAAKKAYNSWKNCRPTESYKRVNGILFPEQDTFFQDGIVVFAFQRAINLAPKRRVAVDIGAHCGFSTRYFSERFQKVIAFEPNPETFHCLLGNTESLANVVAYEKALGDTVTEVLMEYDMTRYGNTGCYRVSNAGRPTHVDKLDNYKLEEVDFIKIDVEGYELEVLKGGMETLERNKPIIIMEVKKGMSELRGVDYLEAPKYLESLGYKKVSEHKTDWIFQHG